MVSFIVPVYNAEKYIGRCIDSLLDQSCSDFEIILIDDGSKDRSLEICNEYMAKDEGHIRVIHKENGGVSSARNVGIDAASGDFVAFIDADDYVLPDYLETLLNKAKENDADIVCCDFKEVVIEGLITPNAPRVRKERLVTNGYELFSDILREEEGYPFCVWGKIIKTEFARKVSFKNMKFGEDHLYMFDVFALQPKTYLTTYQGYCYAPNEGSVTVRIDATSVKRMADVLSMQRYKVQNLPDFAQNLEKGYYKLYAGTLVGFIGAVCRHKTEKEDIFLARSEAKKIITQKIAQGGLLKIKLLLFYMSPKAYAFALKLLKRKI